MNRFILKRHYSIGKYLSVLAITVGIIICTLATSNKEVILIKLLLFFNLEFRI